MPEVAPVLGIAPAPAVGARVSGTLAGDRAAAREPPPRPPPKPAAASPPAPAARPGGEVVPAGLLLEALVRPHRPGGDGLTGPALRGIARVLPVPVAPGSGTPSVPAPAPGGPWLEGERLATVLGSAGPDGLLAEADGLAILLRGPRLHLPPGARLRIAWERPPTVVEPRRAEAVESGAAPRTQPADRVALSAERPARAAEPGPGPRAEPRGPPAPLEGAPVTSARAVAEPAAPLVEEGVRRFGRSLGLAVERVDEEDGRARRESRGRAGEEPEVGRSVFVLELPELGRVRLELAWSRRGVELAIAGLPELPGGERAAFLEAFEAALAASGARGRAVLLTAPTGAPPVDRARDADRDRLQGSEERPDAAGEGP